MRITDCPDQPKIESNSQREMIANLGLRCNVKEAKSKNKRASDSVSSVLLRN